MSTQGQVEQESKGSFLKRPIGGGGGKPAPAPKAGKFGIPPRPQVNLMPPEVLEGRKLVVLRRRLVWAIIFLLVIIALVFAGAYALRLQAESRYEESLAHADQLTAQKRQYAPVVTVLNDIDNTKDARTFALSTEVNWNNLVYSIQAVLPDGVTIDTVTVTGTAPGGEPAEAPDDLTQAGIGVINFTASTDTLPDASAWIDALNTVPGLADTNLHSSVLQDDEGATVYEVAVTVQVTEDALAHRTFADEQAPADESTDTDAGDEG